MAYADGCKVCIHKCDEADEFPGLTEAFEEEDVFVEEEVDGFCVLCCYAICRRISGSF